MAKSFHDIHSPHAIMAASSIVRRILAQRRGVRAPEELGLRRVEIGALVIFARLGSEAGIEEAPDAAARSPSNP
jgi:hypothetical protein